MEAHNAIPTGYELADRLGSKDNWTTQFKSKNTVRFTVDSYDTFHLDLDELDIHEKMRVEQWAERHNLVNVSISISECEREN